MNHKKNECLVKGIEFGCYGL